MRKQQYSLQSFRLNILASIGTALVLSAIPCNAADPCQGLLSDGLRNVVRSFETEDIERAAYKKHCSKHNDRYSFSDQAEFMWYFRATASPNFDARSGDQWCRENASRLEQSSTKFLEVLTFSNEALRAFNACVRQQKENVLTDAIMENDILVLSVWRNTGRPSVLQRFDYDTGALACTATGAAENGQPINVDLSAPIKLVEDRRVSIVCRRKLENSAQDGVGAVRPKTTVALTTDLGTPLALTLEEQKYLQPATVEELRASIALAMESQIIIPWLPFDWEGNPRSIPKGWAICDGSQKYGSKFPNLKGRFLMGSSDESTEKAGLIGGYSGFDKRSGRYQGDPTRDYLRLSSDKYDLRPPWYAVVFLCRVM